MTIGHIAATTLEQTVISACKQTNYFQPSICFGVGKIMHEGVEVIIDSLMPVFFHGATQDINKKNIFYSISGSIVGSQITEYIAPKLCNSSSNGLDIIKLSVIVGVGASATLALPFIASLGAFSSTVVIASVSTLTDKIYDYYSYQENESDIQDLDLAGVV